MRDGMDNFSGKVAPLRRTGRVQLISTHSDFTDSLGGNRVTKVSKFRNQRSYW